MGTRKLNVTDSFSTEEKCICDILKHCLKTNERILINECLREILDDESITGLDSTGGTAFHHLVSHTCITIENYAELINELLTGGIDIDHQNKKGQTALHLAAAFGNKPVALALLQNGADINVTDATSQTPFAISYKKSNFYFEDDSESSDDENDYEGFDGVFKILATHAHKLRYCEMYLNKLNKQMLNKGTIYKYLRVSQFDNFHNEVEKIKTIAIGSLPIFLYDFLFKLNSESLYRNMIHYERQEIDEFFKNIKKYNLPELDCIIALRYKEITLRLRLTERAIDSLNALINYYQIPDLCCRYVLKYLENSDLKRLILATT